MSLVSLLLKFRAALFRPVLHELQEIKQIISLKEIERLNSQPKYQDNRRLEKFGYKVYSQNDEDGIIEEIFARIGTTNKVFIEFGVEIGLESNTHFLLLKDWVGLWIEGNLEKYGRIMQIFSFAIQTNKLKVVNSYVTRDNINKLISSEKITGEIDLLSIDIDGNDFHVLKSIDVVNPRVIIVEYNPIFPPNFEWVMKYDPKHLSDATDKGGASLKSLQLLANDLGYQLVGTNLTGVNAFFVRNDLVKDLFFKPAIAELLYNPSRWGIQYAALFPSKHFLYNSEMRGSR